MSAIDDDHWLDHAIDLDGHGFFRIDVSTGQFTSRGALWQQLSGGLGPHATFADFGGLMHDDSRAAVFDSMSALVEGRLSEARVTFRLRPGVSQVTWLESRSKALVRDPAGRAKTLVGSVIDCSELMKAKFAPAALEVKLSQVENRFRSLLASTKDAVWCYECNPPIPLSLPLDDQFDLLLEAKLVDSNAPHMAMHGATDVDQILGQTMKALNRARIGSLREVYKVMAKNKFVLDGARLDDLGGRNTILRAQAAIEHGALARMWGSYADITEKIQAERDREQLEGQLRQAHKMESIGALAGGMAHDFNNVLASILAEADLGAHAIATGDPGELRDSFALIKKSAERGAALTRRLLAFARHRTGPRRRMRIDLLVHELWPMLRRLISESIALRLETPEPLWAVVDPSHIEQSIVTLVVNAREAIGASPGEITVRVAAAQVGAGEVRAKNWVTPGAFVRLTVRDTGPGIDPAMHERIFEPFFTTKPPGEGSGLGLSMVYGILKQHEGFAEVRNAEGGGAQFDLSLPRVSPEANVEPSFRTPIPSAPANERVLLVEDQPELRESARRILESGGYQVKTAVDGLDAAQVFTACGPFEVLVLDVVMPHCSGPRFYEGLAEPRPPVLFTSGYNEEALDGPLFTGAGRGYVAKPYGREGLLWALRSVLDSRE